MIDLLNQNPVISLVIGVAILIFPRIVNYVIAAVFIFIGVTGIWPDVLPAATDSLGGALGQ